MKFATLLSAGLMLAPSAQAAETQDDRCMGVAEYALRSASAAEAGVPLFTFLSIVAPEGPSKEELGTIFIAYGIYLLNSKEPMTIAANLYNVCMGEAV